MHLPPRSCEACVALGLVFAAPASASAQDAFRLQQAIDAPAWLAVSASFRARYETLDNAFVAGRQGGDELLSTQSLLRLEAHNADLAAGIELMDVRRFVGNDGGAAPAETDAIEPLQAYLAWRPGHVLAEDGRVDLTVGRFSLDLGSRRLVARSLMRFVQTIFTGVRAAWSEPGGLSVTGFYTAPATREPSDPRSALKNEIALNRETNTRFGGLLVEAPLGREMHGDVYLYDLDEADAPRVPTRNRRLTTYGIHLRRPPTVGAPDFELEAVQQVGRGRATTAMTDTTDLAVNAHMFHIEAGYTFQTPWSPRLALLYDLASGDRDPTDTRSQRFDPLFGDRRFDLGPTGIYGAIARTNFRSPSLRVEIRPDALSDAFIAWRAVRLDSARDGFANSNVRDPAGASGDDPGDQVEARYRRWLLKEALRLEVGATWLREGRFLRQAPNATRQGDPVYGYLEVQWTF